MWLERRLTEGLFDHCLPAKYGGDVIHRALTEAWAPRGMDRASTQITRGQSPRCSANVYGVEETSGLLKRSSEPPLPSWLWRGVVETPNRGCRTSPFGHEKLMVHDDVGAPPPIELHVSPCERSFSALVDADTKMARRKRDEANVIGVGRT